MRQKIIYSTFLVAIFLMEGLGFFSGRELALIIILMMPFFIYFNNLIERKKIVVPEKITILFIVFLFFSAVSTLLAVNKQRSFEYLLYHIALFLIFVYTYNFKKELTKLVINLIFLLSGIFLFYSIVIKLLPNFAFLIPTRGYQYVYPFYKTHNPLGEFLLIVLTMSLFFSLWWKIYFLLFFTFLPAFLFSYSRAAYLSLTVVIGLMAFYIIRTKSNKKLFYSFLLMGGVMVVSLFLFFVVVNYNRKMLVISRIREIMVSNYDLGEKTFFSWRDEYFKQAGKAILEKPFFGFGPYNFIYASIKHASIPRVFGETSENIFLETLAENGIFAGMTFILIIIFLIKSVFGSLFNKKNLFSKGLVFVFLSMFVIFQVSSVQRFYSYLLLFYIIAALIYEEEERCHSARFFYLLPIVLFLVANLIVTSSILMKTGHYQQAFCLYPLNKKVYPVIIAANLFKQKTKANMYLKLYGEFFSGDPNILFDIGKIYEEQKELEKAIFYYTKAYQANKFLDFNSAKHIYNLKKKIEGVGQAKEFYVDYLKNFAEAKNTYFITFEEKKKMLDFCWEIKGILCPKTL